MNYMCVCVFTTKILTTVRDFHSLVYHLYKSNHGNFPINSEFSLLKSYFTKVSIIMIN